MKRSEFFKEMKDKLDIDEKVTEGSVLEDLEEWDSLAMITVLALYKKTFGLNIPASKIKEAKTFKDLLDSGNEKYE